MSEVKTQEGFFSKRALQRSLLTVNGHFNIGAYMSRSKYTPHQGNKEMARRRKQASKAK